MRSLSVIPLVVNCSGGGGGAVTFGYSTYCYKL